MIATLDHIDQLTPYIRTYWFRTERPLGQTAGEFTELHVPHADMDKRGDKRWFTISSSPTEPLIGITTKVASSGGSSFKRALQALQPGHQVSIAEPMGDFVLPKDKTLPLIFVAGGLGITPVRSIIQYLLDRNEDRNIQVFRTVSSIHEAVFADTLKQYPLTYHQYDASENQRLGVADILAAVRKQTYIYLAGPERFIQKLAADLQKKGVPSRHIVTDLFPGYDTSLPPHDC